MKKKIKFLGLISTFVFIAVFAIAIKSFANTEEPGEKRYNTEVCLYFLEDGSTNVGTWCRTPSADGSCMRISNCML